jgi:diketogulonate reductase-like aldo/keto reductase
VIRARPFGPGGPSVPAIGQGTWNVPERGLTHIDTAEMYGSGEAERIVGEAIAGVPRESLFIVSKVLPSNASKRGTVQACEASLRRMKLDYLDCYLLHWPGSTPIAETLAAMASLRQAGKIRSFGLSNFDLEEWNEARAISCSTILVNAV